MTWQVEQAKDASHAPTNTNRQPHLKINQFEQEFADPPDQRRIRAQAPINYRLHFLLWF